MNSGSVTIEQLHSVYRVSRRHPAPEEARARLDAVARSRMTERCGMALYAALAADDPSIWLIRRLELDVTLDIGGASDDALALAWAEEIARSIVRIIEGGPDGDLVVRFADGAEYTAQFIRDLAAGRAWDRWYYEDFDSLRVLPSGTAVREALARAPEQAETVLLRLAATEDLERALDVLSENDAAWILEVGLPNLSARMPGEGPRAAMEALASVWTGAAPRLFPSGLATARNALRLYLALRERRPDVPAGRPMRTAVERLLEFAEVQRRMPVRGPLLARLAAGDVAGAVALARESGVRARLESLPFVARAAASDDDWLRRVARQVGGPETGREADEEEMRDTAWTFATPFAGLFLLLPHLMELGLSELLAAAPSQESRRASAALPHAVPEPAGMSREQALRLLLALKCLGRPRALEAAGDPAVLLAAGLNRPPALDALAQWSAAATEEENRLSLRTLIAALARLHQAEGRCLAVERAEWPPGRAVLLLRDAAGDAWLYAGEDGPDALREGLCLMEEAFGAPPECLLLRRGMGEESAPDAFAGRVVREDEPESEALPEDMRAVIAGFLARARPAEADLQYLSLEDLLPLSAAPVGFDLAWSLIARAALRDFARRLMGFEGSSLEYLYRNFLAGRGVVRVEPERIAVQLPLSPLRIVLRMAGVDGQSYTIPWLDDRPVTLSLAAD
jgi:hypothetical protein